MTQLTDSGSRYAPPWWHIQRATRTLNSGGTIAYPTEAVWGLGCDPWDEEAVERILELKRRPVHKGLILVASSAEQVMPLLDPLDSIMRDRALSYWPGPVTCLIPDPLKQTPEWIRGRHSAVAVRVSDHPLVQRLCESFGGPLVSTSCNPAGRTSARTPWQVRGYFGDELDYILPGDLGRERRPSRIIDLESGRQLR